MRDVDRRAILLGAGALAGLAGWTTRTAPTARADPDEPVDLNLLRRTFTLAEQARSIGGAPYGALVADVDGNVVAEQGNTSSLSGGDPTQHAELVATSSAWRTLGYDGMAVATLYASTEPCTMCSGAAYWTGIGRVVYGLSVARLLEFTGDTPDHASFALPSRELLTHGARPVAVVGPLLEDEAAQAHRGYWR